MFVLGSILKDRLKERRLVKRLRSRPQLDDQRFREQFFHDDLKRGELAIQVRRVLSKNLQIPLEGLRPEDRLNADLKAELERNPHLFWELETELGINMDVDDLEAFEQHAERIVTFSDLVDYVERRAKEKPPTKTVTATVGEPSWKVYDWAIQSIPYLCITGWVTALLGAILGRDWAVRLGTCLFLSGFAVWGLANGGGLLWEYIQTIRERGFRVFTEQPLWSFFYALFVLFLVCMGGWFLWMVFKASGQSK